MLQPSISRVVTGNNYFPLLLAGLVATTCWAHQPVIERHYFREKTAEIYHIPTIHIERTDAPAEQKEIAAVSAQEAVAQVRLLSGLTQEHISEILDVDRRSIYHWLAGQEPSDSKYEKLMRVLSALQYIDRGITRINKRILLSPVGEGKILKDYLTEGDFQKFIQTAGAGNQNPKIEISKPAVSPLERGKIRLSEMLSD